jgi:class 3 adenylate cyclase/predicted ATPase
MGGQGNMAMEIRAWLETLNMGQYADVFEENQLTTEDLPDLTDLDLKELGVAAMGHRKSMLRRAASGAAPSAGDGGTVAEVETGQSTPAATPASVKPAVATGGAERRQLTVMFADLVGSTELAARLDPEDVRDALTKYQEVVAREVVRYEGNVAKYMGDGVLCYFGWPQAHEDDAERAARAALKIIAALRQTTAPNGEKLEARIGVATGLVVVGDLIGEGAAQEEAVVGETPNLAARLQGAAQPGQIVVSDTTKQLLSRTVEVEHLGLQDLKGISRPVEAYAIVGEQETSNEDRARHHANSTPLVGRQTEVAMLLDRWSRSVEGEGQAFILSGEPGIGKSQVSTGFINKLVGQPHQVLHFQCSPYFSSSAFHPIIGFLERLANFTREDTDDDKLGKLEDALATAFNDVAPVAVLFAAMLSLPLDKYPPTGLEPLKQKEKTIAAFVDFIDHLSRQEPLLFLFEDAQCCDATSLELLTSLIYRVEGLPVLVLVTHRQEFQSPWQKIGHVTHYALNRLAKRHSASIIEEVAGGKVLPEKIVEQILAKTDGIPLYVEELTKTILEAGFLVEGEDAYTLDGPLPPFAIPSTLQDSLMARLDRLSPLKEVAQTGACIGREFTYELLASVLKQSDGDLQQSLDQLVENELIIERGKPPGASYTFKQALVQDAAYNSLLKSRRQQLHTKIAQALQEIFQVMVDLQPELAAQHLTAAGLMQEAVPYWLKAGQLAIAKSANEEAINHLTSGLDCLYTLPESTQRDEQELLLRATLGVSQFTARGYGAPELGDNYEKALSIVRRIGDTPFKSAAMFGVWAYHLMRVNHAKATEVYSEAMEQAKQTGVPHEMTAALAAATTSSIFKGEAPLALEYSEASWRGYDIATHGDMVALYGQDIGLWCADFGSWATWLMGRADEADRRYGEANRIAGELGHPLSLASGLVHQSLLYSMAGEVERTMDYADQTIVVCEEVGIPARLVEALIMKGWALSEQGQLDEGITLTQQGMAGWRGAGAEIARPWWLALLSQQYSRKGDLEAAMAALDEGFSTIEMSGERLWLPELHRLRGQLLLQMDTKQLQAAEKHFRSAITVASEQMSKFWELRAAVSLGELLKQRGEDQQAAALVRPLVDGFTEGLETRDLREAGQFLASITG